jgi:transcriptional regulator with XRE-family HTH domain
MTQTFSPPEVSPKEMGKHLRDVRRRKGLSLSEVARGAGLSRRELVAYERGKAPIPESDLWVLAGSCGVDVAELRPTTGPRAVEAGPESITDSISQLRRAHDESRAAALPAAPSIEAAPGPVDDVPSELLEMPVTEPPPGSVDIFEELASLPEPAPLPSRGDPPPDFLAPPSDLEDLTFPVSSAATFAPVVAVRSDARADDLLDERADVPTVDLVDALATRGSSTISATDAPPLDVPFRSESVTLPPKEPVPAPDFSDPTYPSPNGGDDPVSPFADADELVEDVDDLDTRERLDNSSEPLAAPAAELHDLQAYDFDSTPPLPAPDLEEMIDPEPLPDAWEISPWATGDEPRPIEDELDRVGTDSFDFFTTSDLLGPDPLVTDPVANNGHGEHLGPAEQTDADPTGGDDWTAWSSRTPDPAATDSGFFVDWGTQGADDRTAPNFEPGAGELPSREPGASDWLRDLSGTESRPLTPAEALAAELRSFDAAFGPDSADPAAEATVGIEPSPADLPPADPPLDTQPLDVPPFDTQALHDVQPLDDQPLDTQVLLDVPVTPLVAAEAWVPDATEPLSREAQPEDPPADDEPAPISWHPETDASPSLPAAEQPPTIAASVAIDEVFVTAGDDWALGNALPLVEVRGQGALVMRRADERWALADLRCGDEFALEVALDFRSGPGFGVLFRADITDGRMSGYSFDLDPIYDGGSFLVRQWQGDRELWNPIAHIPASDPSSLCGHLKIRLEVAGARIVALVNGDPVLSVDDLEQASAERGREGARGDRVGVQAWSSSDLVIETLRVADHTR